MLVLFCKVVFFVLQLKKKKKKSSHCYIVPRFLSLSRSRENPGNEVDLSGGASR